MSKVWGVFALWAGLLMISVVSRGSGTDPRCHRSTEGTEFWFGFMEGRNTIDHYVELTVSSRVGANFQLFIGKSPLPYNNQTYSVLPNSALQLRIPFSEVEPTGSERILPLGLHLISDQPVNLYLLNRDRNSSDVAVMYPVGSLGTDHYAMCYTPPC